MARVSIFLFRTACLAVPFLCAAGVHVTQARAQEGEPSPCDRVRADLAAAAFNPTETATHVRAAFDADPAADCIRPGLDRIEARIREIDGSLSDDALTMWGIAEDQTLFDTMIAGLDGIAETLRPIIGRLRLRSLDRVITRFQNRVRQGIRRGRAIAPFDFRRAVIDPETHRQPQTCDLAWVGSPRPPWPSDSPPGDRPLYVPIACAAGGRQIRVYVWLTRDEAARALDWTPRRTPIGLRIVRVDTMGVPETTIDTARTRELDRLYRNARERMRNRIEGAETAVPPND